MMISLYSDAPAPKLVVSTRWRDKRLKSDLIPLLSPSLTMSKVNHVK